MMKALAVMFGIHFAQCSFVESHLIFYGDCMQNTKLLCWIIQSFVNNSIIYCFQCSLGGVHHARENLSCQILKEQYYVSKTLGLLYYVASTCVGHQNWNETLITSLKWFLKCYLFGVPSHGITNNSWPRATRVYLSPKLGRY